MKPVSAERSNSDLSRGPSTATTQRQVSQAATIADTDSIPTTQPGNIYVVDAPFTGTPSLWMSGDAVFGVPAWVGEDQLLFNTLSQTAATFHVVNSVGDGFTAIFVPYWFLSYWP